MAKQVTTQELAERIDGLTASMETLVNVLTASSMPTAEVEVQPKAESESTVKVDKAYETYQSGKAQGHANEKGENVVLYARRNKAGQTKIAYALEARFKSQIARQPSCLGAIKLLRPQS